MKRFYTQTMATFLHKLRKLFKSKWALGIGIVIILGGGYWFFIRTGNTSYQFITVTQGSITETVSVTGNTTPMKSVSLGFQNSGTIARITYNLGDQVSTGAVVAELNTGISSPHSNRRERISLWQKRTSRRLPPARAPSSSR